MRVLGGVVNRAAFLSLILGRVAYAVNWYSLAAVFSLTAAELHQNISGLGLVTSAFFLGIGVFQVPGGVLAAKVGPRLTAIYGTFVASLAALLTGFAGNLLELTVLRFFVGAGMAFVFAPGVILMAKFLRKGSEGLGVGLYNAAFGLGAAIGLFGWGVLAAVVGWRISLITAGLLGIFTSVLLLLLVPKDDRRLGFTVELRHLKLVLLDRWLILLSIAMLGFQLGSTVYSSFMPYYLESKVNLDVGEAGTIASLASLFALASAPFAGRLFDRYGETKRLLLASGALMAFGVSLAFLGTVYSAILSGILTGLAYGAGFTFGFSAAREANKLDLEYETLAVSWVNSLSLFGNFVPPTLYSYFVLEYGYSHAWLYMAILSFLLVVPVLFQRGSARRPANVETC
jgi:MFS family permease